MDSLNTFSNEILFCPNVSWVVVSFSPSGSTVTILALYLPYAKIGLSQKIVSAFIFNATDICAQPVSFPMYKSQFEIIFKESLILRFSKENELFPTLDLLNWFIKSISFLPPAI